MNRKTVVYFLLILAVAAGARLAALDRIPYGVFIDEGVNGVEGIQAVRTGHFHFYYPANSTEGLWVALIGYSEKIFGVNPFGLRFSSAAAGFITVVFVFLLARRLFGDRVALLSSFYIATGFWHLLFSRLAINAAIVVPLLLTTCVYFLILAARETDAESRASTAHRRLPAWAWAILAGATYGLGFYTYLPFRATPLLVVLILLAESQRRRALGRALKPWLKVFALFLITAIAVAAPLGIYFARHPEQFSHRMSQVSITQQAHPVQTELQVIRRTAGMFNFHGDENWRHNYAGKPQLLAPVGIFFLAGLCIVVAQACRAKSQAPEEWILIAWFGIMLLPELLTNEGIPHAMRAIGVIVPVYIFAAVGTDLALARAGGNKLLHWLLICIIVGAGIYDPWRYFHDWARHGAHIGKQTFSQQQADEAVFLNSLPASTSRFVISDEGPTSPLHNDPALAQEVDYHMAMRAQTVAFATMEHPKPTFMDISEALAGIEHDHPFAPGSVIVPLEGRQSTLDELRRRGLALDVRTAGSVLYGEVR